MKKTEHEFGYEIRFGNEEILIIKDDFIDKIKPAIHGISPTLLIAPKRIIKNECFMSCYYPAIGKERIILV